ncbi:hypothetical protein PMZ80_007634 [Knufia obscura]|uniref:AAA+ ATPase domain-containing protein n=1 Tax=Knufia obscura TaxID=1635080 RepID=A0ABR0RHX5_9EURO|nr:hypothetical protein PMZ80_007634 [Knufia obscura]
MDLVKSGHEHMNDLSLNGIVGLLGVPGYILATFFPVLAEKARRHPLLFKSIAAVLVVVSTLFAAGRYLNGWVDMVLNHCISRVAMRGHDVLARTFHDWLDETPYRVPCRIIEGQSAAYIRRNFTGPVRFSSKHKGSRLIKYFPRQVNYFWHNWRLFRVSVVPEEGEDDMSTWIDTFGFSTRPLKQLLDEVWEWRLRDQAEKLTEVLHASHGYWRTLALKRVRSMSTLDLAEGVLEPLIKDVADFLTEDAVTQYAARGIPHRRGYLFHGPPGTGKSSLTLGIAGHFDMDIQVLSLADPDMNDVMLTKQLTWMDKPSILLLEDIDSAGLSREVAATSSSADKDDGDDDDAPGKSKSRVTLSGLLNALDGVGAPEDCIVIMTTNCPEALDPALTRPGRIDYKVEFHNVDNFIARKQFLRMTATNDKLKHEKLADDFAAMIPKGQLSPAELQGFLLGCGSSAQTAVDGASAWVEKTLAEKEKQKEQADMAGKATEEAASAQSDSAPDDSNSTDTVDVSTAGQNRGPDEGTVVVKHDRNLVLSSMMGARYLKSLQHMILRSF